MPNQKVYNMNPKKNHYIIPIQPTLAIFHVIGQSFSAAIGKILNWPSDHAARNT